MADSEKQINVKAYKLYKFMKEGNIEPPWSLDKLLGYSMFADIDGSMDDFMRFCRRVIEDFEIFEERYENTIEE